MLELLEQLQQQDIRLWLEQGQLRFSAPSSGLSAELRDQIRQHKTEIIAFLQQSQSATTPITVVDIEKPQPLSFAQQRLWFLQQLEPDNTALNLPFALTLQGKIDLERLNAAINQLLQQHSILRTAYYQNAQGLWQQVLAYQPFQLTVESIAENDLSHYLQQLNQQPFKLQQGEVFRCRLLQQSATQAVLFFSVHHIATDGWSMQLMAQQILQLYQQRPITPSLQYQDFAVWQQQQDYSATLAYWKQQLADIPALQLPSRSQANSTQQGASLAFQLNIEQTNALKALAKQENVSLFILLMAIFSCLLHRYSQQSLFSIGSPVAGRNQPQLENVLGCFINLIAIRCEHQEQSFSDYLASLRTTILQALNHQDAPFEQVVQQLQNQRGLNQSPIFQVLFSLQNPQTLTAEVLPSLQIEALPLDKQTALYDIHLNIQEWQGQLLAEFTYRTASFSETFIANLAQSMQQIVTAILSDKQQLVSRLPCTSDYDQQLQLNWQQTYRQRQELPTVQQYIEQQALLHGERIAVRFGNQQLSYTQLNQAANQLAHWLLLQPQKPFIGVHLQRSLQLPICLLAILKAGRAYLPIEHDFPAQRIRDILHDADLDLLLSDDASLQLNLPQLRLINPTQLILTQQSLANPDIQPNQSLFNLIYTSGSTGKPKGVLLSHHAMINRLLWMQEQYPLSEQDRVLHKTSISFDVSVWEIFWPLMQGACVVLAEPEQHKNPAVLLQTITEQRITHVHFVPSMLMLFLQYAQPETCQTLKQIICSGETLTPTLARQCLAQLPSVKLANLYGPTEAAIDISYHDCLPNELETPIGRPIANNQIFLLDQQGQLLPIGAVGEIVLSGRNLADGYLHETAHSGFIEHPLFAGERAYRTGDLGRFDEQGNLYFLGRKDQQVKIRGFRVELSEIAFHLQQHPLIQDALVTAQTSQSGDLRIVAYFIGRKPSLSTETLREFLQKTLPSYMLPNYFIQIEQWPLTNNDKIARHLLPSIEQYSPYHAEFMAPRDTIEQAVADIWQDLLGIKDISVNDNFFSLGGHSLLASMAVSRMQEHFSVTIPLAEIFVEPTIANAAMLIRALQSEKQLLIDGPLQQGEHEIHL